MLINNRIRLNSYKENHGISFTAAPLPVPFVKNAGKILDTTLSNKGTVFVVPHRSPDNDAGGSGIGFCISLALKGVKTAFLCVGEIPEKIAKLANESGIQILNPSQIKKITQDDALFVFDLNDTSRLPDSVNKIVKRFKIDKRVVLDHHKTGQSTLVSDTIHIDPNAKAASELTFQLINDLNLPKNSKNLTALYYGFMDDLIKSGHVDVIENNGKIRFKTAKQIPQETRNELVRLYRQLDNSLKKENSPNTIQEIRKNLNFMNNLTPEYQKFWDGLFNRVEYKFNNKVALIKIHPKDAEWKALNQDNTDTSVLLNNFRRNLLKTNPELKAVITFYRGPKLENPNLERYHMSIHSQEGSGLAGTVTTYVNKYKETFKSDLLSKYRVKLTRTQGKEFMNKHKNTEFNAGGHADRAGGNFPIQNSHDFVRIVMGCPELKNLKASRHVS